jgi:tRNA G18 (ribose-2'-O)-methylase SpoU
MIARVMHSILDDSRLAPYRLVADPPALEQAGLFAVEGRLALPYLLASRYRVHSVLVSETAFAALEDVLTPRKDVQIFVAPADAMSAIAGIDFHRGALALGYRGAPETLDAVLPLTEPSSPGVAPLVVLEGVNNPDNVGGIFRSAHAFGARAVLLGQGCGDPLYRKAVRTSMGTALLVPWTELHAWTDDLRRVRDRGYRLVALTPDPVASSLREVVRHSAAPIAFLVGSEGYGLSPGALASAATVARIPMLRTDADSLNVAAAVSIALYECTATRPTPAL